MGETVPIMEMPLGEGYLGGYAYVGHSRSVEECVQPEYVHIHASKRSKCSGQQSMRRTMNQILYPVTTKWKRNCKGSSRYP